VWRGEDEWPLARTVYTRYHLGSATGANSMFGDGTLTPEPSSSPGTDRYEYDPARPVPTLGGPIMHRDFAGPHDRRPVERRDDVLVYTSEPLERDLEVTGPVEMTLYASSSARDTDFAATLVDVYPDGRAINICEGLQRARFRESIEESALIEPGRVYRYTIDMWETSIVFKAGHRIRVEVTSSNFPRMDRNPNTGNRPGMDAETQAASQTVHHGGERASHITLPVIPR
jgi:putative CocE/NonD family hydrolase